MIRRMRFKTTHLLAALAATLFIGMATGASAAIEPATAEAPNPGARKPIEELEQLAEIRVRGKSLVRTITDAEDDFFKLYNKLNRNPDFEIVCGHMRVNGSLIMQRKCVPGFIADYVTDYARPIAFFGRTYGCVSAGMSASLFGTGGSQMFEGAGCSQGISTSMSMPVPMSTPVPMAIAGRPPVALLSMSKREAYLKNVLQVINSDPELVAKVWHLKSLYGEMKQVQGRYMKVSKTDLLTTRPTRLRPR